MAGCGAGACNIANSKKEATSSTTTTTKESGHSICGDYFAMFCNKEVASVAMSFISFLSSALMSGLAYFRIHKVAKDATSSSPNLTNIMSTSQ